MGKGGPMKLPRVFRRSNTRQSPSSSLGSIPESRQYGEMRSSSAMASSGSRHYGQVGHGGATIGRANDNEEFSSSSSSSGKVEWEVRPGGMLVQRRDASSSPASSLGRLIRIKVSYGTLQLQITIPQQSTFGDMKWVLAKETGLKPMEQRILYKGKEKEDNDYLHIAGVEDQAKVTLVEDPASKERKLLELNKSGNVSDTCHLVALIREEVDRLALQFAKIERLVNTRGKVMERDFATLSELLTRQLLKLDTINAEGEAKVQRKTEVNRVQKIIEAIDGLKAQNARPPPAAVTPQWENFDLLSGPVPQSAYTTASPKWEVFD